MKVSWVIVASVLWLLPAAGFAADSGTVVPMAQQGAATYYVDGDLAGFGATHFMVDTGSGFTVINEHTLKVIKAAGRATYLRKLQGILADGTGIVVPVYRLDEIKIGSGCSIRDVEVAVLPRARHPILGLSALQKVAPFVFSVDPPRLQLSHCLPGSYADAAATDGTAAVARADAVPSAASKP